MKRKPTNPGINPAAHWTKVVSAIASAYGISFAVAKFVYDRMRETSGRTPSLRAVAKLPDPLPDYLWNPAPKPSPKPLKPPKPQPPPQPLPKAPKPRKTAAKAAAKTAAKAAAKTAAKAAAKRAGKPRPIIELGKGRKLPPPPKPAPPPSPIRLPNQNDARLKPRTAFEAQLKKDGLPVTAIARRNELGKLIGQLDEKVQTRIAKALGRAYKQLENRGYVSGSTIQTIKKLIKKSLGKSLGEIPWNFIFKFLYGKK